MTCGVGIAKDGTIWLGADSAAASLQDREIYSLKNAKVFRSGAYGLTFTTSYRLGQILRYETELPDPPADDLERFMAGGFVGAVRRSLEAAGYQGGLGEHGSILVGVRGQLFTIGTEFQIIVESTPYVAVGAGRHVAYGALYALEHSGKPPRERVEIALRAAQTFSPLVREPFTLIEIPPF